MKIDTLTQREKSVLAGLYLSKFDFEGLKYLGFDRFTEAFNVIGLAMNIQPASVKNYRDEFDPLFPNKRKGWHKREIRKYCKDIYDTFGNQNLLEFSNLLKSIIYRDHDLDILFDEIAKAEGDKETSFAKRLVTGRAAEQYFRDNFSDLDLFSRYEIQDTTQVGCGFDFKLTSLDNGDYLGVEVKGMNEARGNISLTSKEHTVASILKDKYYIFVVKNFREKPIHSIYQDPLSIMDFKKVEHFVTQISWNTTI